MLNKTWSSAEFFFMYVKSVLNCHTDNLLRLNNIFSVHMIELVMENANIITIILTQNELHLIIAFCYITRKIHYMFLLQLNLLYH